jgi:hypothetical protein
VAISEKVASSVASVKADCATVAKVEAGVTVRSISDDQGRMYSVAKAIVGSGDDLKIIKRD